MGTVNLAPLQRLLLEKSPKQIAEYLDESMCFLVMLNEYEGLLVGTSHHYQMLRALRDTLLETVNERPYGDR